MMNLQHGDCLELMRDIPDKSVDMILCDLPYGTTACKWDVVIPFAPLWEQYKRVIKDRGAIVLFGSEPFSSYLRMSNIEQYKYDWIWNKKLTGSPAVAKYRPLPVFENVIVFGKNKVCYFPEMRIGKMRIKGRKTLGTTGVDISENWKGLRNGHFTKNDRYFPTNVLDVSNAHRSEKVHPTQKPVALLEYLIKTYTLEGETVLDNCMGSGSTGVACVNTKRQFIGIEKDDTYFEIAKQRIENAQ